MTVQTFNLTGDCSTDASFRAWGKAISDALTALGFPKTSDTGQVDWSTVAHPTVVNTSAGYEIRRFNDTLQATAPLFFKIEYGSGLALTIPSVWVTAGTGSDGAGAITGTTPTGVANLPTTRNQVPASTSSAVTAVPSYLVADDDAAALTMLLWTNNTAGAGALVLIERTRDWTGAPTGDGFMLAMISPGSSKSWPMSLLPANNANAANSTTTVTPFTTTAAPSIKTCLVGNVCYPVPFPLALGPRSTGPSKMVMLVSAGDLPASTTFPLTVYGSSQTWFAIGKTSGADMATGTGLQSWIARIS